LVWVPRVLRSAQQLEDAGDCRALAAKADFDTLAKWQTPCGSNLIAQCGYPRRFGVVTDIETETDLMLAQVRTGAVRF